MTLAQMEAAVKRHLGVLAGITDQRLTQSGGVGGTWLRDALTEARDVIRARLASSAPLAVVSVLDLTMVGTSQRYALGLSLVAGPNYEPMYVSRPREKDTGRRFLPSASLNRDNGDYQWLTSKMLQFADGVNPSGGVEVDAVESLAAVGMTNDATIGLPVAFRQPCARYAAYLLLISNEESSGTALLTEYERQMERLEVAYSQLDEGRGSELREELLMSYGSLYGDSLG